MTTLGTVYCVGIHLFMICGYLSPWHDVSSGCRWRRGERIEIPCWKNISLDTEQTPSHLRRFYGPT